jgi:hypothetical protein
MRMQTLVATASCLTTAGGRLIVASFYCHQEPEFCTHLLVTPALLQAKAGTFMHNIMCMLQS